MESKEIYNKAKRFIEELDEDKYPETIEYFEELIGDSEQDDLIFPNKRLIASELCDTDKLVDLTPELIDFITELYMDDIQIGNSEAMNDLGAQYYDGHRGFEQSFEKAIKYYKMAAMRGNRQAQENLGYCYYYGRDGEVNYEKAYHYFVLGALDGHLISLYKIGDMYLNGYYVEKNEAEAFHIYMRCIETMTPEAEAEVAGPVYLRLGKMFFNGFGTEKDLMAALTCYQKAERYLYSMVVDDGNYMYKKSLQGAIEGQEKVRKEMTEKIKDKNWID